MIQNTKDVRLTGALFKLNDCCEILLVDCCCQLQHHLALSWYDCHHSSDCCCMCNESVYCFYALQGDAKAQICEFCEDQSMDLLVVTSTVRGRFKKALSPMGGVSSQLVLEAPCPVLVLPTQASSKRPNLLVVAKAGLLGVSFHTVAPSRFYHKPCPVKMLSHDTLLAAAAHPHTARTRFFQMPYHAVATIQLQLKALPCSEIINCTKVLSQAMLTSTVLSQQACGYSLPLLPQPRHPSKVCSRRHNMSRHVTSRHVTSHHVTSHHITSHHITSHHITSHHITSHHITSHHITSHHITSHHITSHHITSHQITSHHITSLHILNAVQPMATSKYAARNC